MYTKRRTNTVHMREEEGGWKKERKKEEEREREERERDK